MNPTRPERGTDGAEHVAAIRESPDEQRAGNGASVWPAAVTIDNSGSRVTPSATIREAANTAGHAPTPNKHERRQREPLAGRNG